MIFLNLCETKMHYFTLYKSFNKICISTLRIFLDIKRSQQGIPNLSGKKFLLKWTSDTFTESEGKICITQVICIDMEVNQSIRYSMFYCCILVTNIVYKICTVKPVYILNNTILVYYRMVFSENQTVWTKG